MKVWYDPHSNLTPLTIVFSLCQLLAGDEECTRGGTELPTVERAELSGPEALVVPGAERPAHDGPGRAVHTESRLARKRGREFKDLHSGVRRQQLNHI